MLPNNVFVQFLHLLLHSKHASSKPFLLVQHNNLVVTTFCHSFFVLDVYSMDLTRRQHHVAPKQSFLNIAWFKGTVQRQLTGVESSTDQQIILNCKVSYFPIFISFNNGHRHDFLENTNIQKQNFNK